jgi:hypothetical protein
MGGIAERRTGREISGRDEKMNYGPIIKDLKESHPEIWDTLLVACSRYVSDCAKAYSSKLFDKNKRKSLDTVMESEATLQNALENIPALRKYHVDVAEFAEYVDNLKRK